MCVKIFQINYQIQLKLYQFQKIKIASDSSVRFYQFKQCFYFVSNFGI